jgi:hypothetical protein
MEQEIKNILEKGLEDNLQLKDKVDNLRNKIRFCSEHKFEEEKRIALLELSAIEMPQYRQEKLLERLQNLLNAWES